MNLDSDEINIKQDSGKENEEDSGDDVEVLVVMANGRIIRFVRIDENERPFFHVIWENQEDGQGGNSVADNLDEVQQLMNGAFRTFEDNKKMSSNIILAMKEAQIIGEIKSFVHGMKINIDEDASSINDAIQQLVIQDTGDSILQMIDLLYKLADDESNIPRIQQGSTSDGVQTAFEMSQLLEKSGKYLGAVIRKYDVMIKSMVSSFFDFNMEDETPTGQGNYQVVANGFTSFQNKLTKLSALRSALELLAVNPEMSEGIKKEEMFKEFLELLDIDGNRWEMNDEEKESFQAQQQQASQLEQERIELESRKVEVDIMKTEAETQKIKVDGEVAITNSQVKIEELKVKQAELIEQKADRLLGKDK
jgi:hypothetical protein